jgi:glycosyltransferase involved in cell wall biosynthesis
LLTRDWRICRTPSLGCRVYRVWHLRTAADVDLFVSPSQFLLDQHLQAGLLARRTAVVRNGIPLPHDVVSPRNAVRQRKRFVLLARLTEEKGVRVVLQALARLPEALDFELVIAGRGPLEAEMRDAAARDRRVQFIGYVSGDAKHALLASAHCLLIPSLWYENAPVAVIEAAGYGLAVIGSRIGGLPELVRQGRTGVLFEPGDAACLASAIQGFVSEDLKLPDLAGASKALAAEHTVERMADAYLDHYASLLARRDALPDRNLQQNAEIERAA